MFQPACLLRHSRLLVLGAILFNLIGNANAALPEPVIPLGVGVNIHFVTGHEADLDRIKAAGFRFIRMDFGWAGIEREKGVYHWSEYEELLRNLEKRGLRALFILDYSNPLYEETLVSKDPVSGVERTATGSPQHAESVAAFARWAAAAAAHFTHRNVVWEIWNEPNIEFWSPKPNVDQYIQLALTASSAIRVADPQAVVVGPASSGFPWEFLTAFFQSGVLTNLDAVSVHPYRSPSQSPETAATDYQRLRDLINNNAPAARRGKIPILSGEWGYSSCTKGVSLDSQAAFAARQQLVNLLEGVPISIWYDWKNDGPDPAENEHNFGTVYSDLSPKPAYLAIKTLCQELKGYRIRQRLAVGSPEVYVLVFGNPAGDTKIAAWTTSAPQDQEIPLKAVEADPKNPRLDQNALAKAAAWDGEAVAVASRNGKISIPLSSKLIYVTLTAKSVKAPVAKESPAEKGVKNRGDTGKRIDRSR